MYTMNIQNIHILNSSWSMLEFYSTGTAQQWCGLERRRAPCGRQGLRDDGHFMGKSSWNLTEMGFKITMIGLLLWWL